MCPSLCLADVLVDDVAGDGLLLLLLPHEQHTLVDEHILLLVAGRHTTPRVNPETLTLTDPPHPDCSSSLSVEESP